MAIRKKARAPEKPPRRNPPRSLTFPTDLWGAVTDYARARRLPPAAAVRALVAERLDDVARSERLRRAREWQNEQGWIEAQAIAGGDREEVARSEIDAAFEAARRRVQGRRSRSAAAR